MRSVMTLVLVSLFAHVVQLTCRKAEHGKEVHQATETSRPKKGRSTAHSPPQRNTNAESGGNTVTQARPATAGGAEPQGDKRYFRDGGSRGVLVFE